MVYKINVLLEYTQVEGIFAIETIYIDSEIVPNKTWDEVILGGGFETAPGWQIKSWKIDGPSMDLSHPGWHSDKPYMMVPPPSPPPAPKKDKKKNKKK